MDDLDLYRGNVDLSDIFLTRAPPNIPGNTSYHIERAAP